jgi:hypothetical protein
MEVVQVTKEEQQVLDAMRASPKLKGVIVALVEVAQNGELSAKSAGALEKASEALPEPKTPATPTGVRADLPDPREGFAPHRAYLFSVAPSRGSVMDELKELLGERAAEQLAKDWGDRCDLNQSFKGGQVSLFLDSNNKARNRDYADRGDKTTQEEDFKATGHQFAGDLAATLLCARIFRKVRDNLSLSEGEQDLYQKLKDGVLRSCSGALAFDDIARLRARSFHVSWGSNSWALGSPLSPELK